MTPLRRADTNGEAEPDDGSVTGWPARSAGLSLLLVLAYAGIVLLRPGLPENIAFIDPVILVLCAIGLISMTRWGSPATAAAARTLPWLWLVVLGSFIGLSTVGITAWAVSNMARTAFAFLTFFCLWHVISISRSERAAAAGTAIGLGVTAVALVVTTTALRGQAFFNHPNYAGHFTTMAGFLLIAVGKTWRMKAFALVCFGIGVWQTSSFGSIAMALAMLGVVAFRSVKRSTAVLTIALIFVAIFGLFISAPGVDGLPSITEWSPKEVLSEERFDRSQGSRAEIWAHALGAYAQQPWGLGPDGVAQRGIANYNGFNLEVHADGIGYLVERGLPGIIGFIGIWVAIWRSTRPGGIAHMLIVGALVQGLFRETMHYRHMWMLIALAAVFDTRAEERRAAAAAEELEELEAATAAGS